MTEHNPLLFFHHILRNYSFLNVEAWTQIPKKLSGILALKERESLNKFLKKRVFERYVV